MARRLFLAFIVSLALTTACAHLPQLALHPDALTAQEHVTLANTYQAHGETDLALREYRAALAADKRSYPALMALGEHAYHQRKWRQARSYFRKALKASPGDASAINNLAMVDL